ncbi:olefin beta-lactone synthetase OleC [Thermocatellispora tengchongensis]|uniref:fatty acid CoA ligase family protein n=1 Tax=Thermocatellispora tengchongensis TaxID=1073253 RepID=UPI0031F02627
MTPGTPHDAAAPAAVSELVVRAARWASERPGAVACQVGGRTPRSATYREVARSVEATVAALAHAGVRPGMRTVLLAFPGVELGVLALALLRLGAVPVLADPGLPHAAVRRCLNAAAPEAYLGIPLAQAARLVLGWARRSSRVCVTVGPRRLWPGPTLDGLRRTVGGEKAAVRWPPPAPDDLAVIAYTSGATGPPKGVPLRHRHLTAQLDLFGRLGVFREGTAVLSTFAPFALAAAALGATAVVPAMDPRRPMRADPASLAADILRYEVAGMFAAPALLDRLARHCAGRGVVLHPLRVVAVAGAPLPLPTLRRVRACLPEGARVVSVYGATECLPVAAIEGRELASAMGDGEPGAETGASGPTAAGTCLGAPLPGTEVRVIAVTDGPIPRWRDDLAVPPGAVGEIAVCSPAVSDPYLGDPAATALARIPDGERVWHRMGDLGHFDERGRLWFAGRVSERVRTAGGDLYPDHIETLFAGVPGVRRTALVGVGPPGAQRPVLVVEREPGAGRAGVRARVLELAARHPRAAVLRDVLFHPAFPVDARHNSKIRRGVLAGWAARRLRGGGR